MFLIIFVLSIFEASAEQPVIQYGNAEDAHLATPHINKLRLEKHLVILPKISHEAQYLSNPFRREVDTSNFDMQNIKPVTELSLEPPPPTGPIAAALQAAPTKDIFNGLNLNYEVPSYSTPEDFQNSVNALTHMMINKQVKFPGTSYGEPVTDSPENIKASTINALVNMLIGLDKQKKQSDMLNQIVQFMHKKKMQQEQQNLIAQLQQQMQKEQYKPFLQSQDQAEGLVNFMQQLLEPLKQQGLGSVPQPTKPVPTLPTLPTSAGLSLSHPLPNLVNVQSISSSSTPDVQYDWTPAKPSFVNNRVPTTAAASPSIAYQTVVSNSYQPTQHQFVQPAPTIPTYVAASVPPSHSFTQSSPSHGSHHHPSPSSRPPHSPPIKEGYVIRLSKPTLMKEELPLSTVMPKVFHHYVQPKEIIHTSASSHGKESSSFSDMFAPKFEHYIMKHQGEKSKPQLIKLKEENKFSHDSTHSATKYSPKHNQFDISNLEHEFSNGLGHHQSKKHEVIEALKYDDSKVTYDFVNSNNEHSDEMHIHSPYDSFNNHEFDQEFLKNFDNMHFKEENIPGNEESKRSKKPPPKGPQKFIILKKTTKG